MEGDLWFFKQDPTELLRLGVYCRYEYESGHWAEEWIAREVSRENAPLISAAPKLLAACKAALGAFERNDCIGWGGLETAIAEAEKVVLSPLEKRVVDNVIRTAEKEIHPRSCLRKRRIGLVLPVEERSAAIVEEDRFNDPFLDGG